MHPSLHAANDPDRIALIVTPGDQIVTYGDLEARANQTAHLLRSLGLKPGDAIAFSLENGAAFVEIAWAAQRIGLYFVPLSTKLNADEAAYIIRDSGAKAVVISTKLDTLAASLPSQGLDAMLFAVDGARTGYRNLEAERSGQPSTLPTDAQAGYPMLYSSGSTGRPKGIRPQAITDELIDAPTPMVRLVTGLYGVGPETIYLCPAPLYHAAPLSWSMAVQRLGGTVVVMERFEPAAVLEVIERHRITTAQFVPTHFVRMLKLPEAERAAHDLSSLRVAVHAAAPCPVPIKEAMMAWWGPVIYEYYSGSEGAGGTFINPHEWLSHKGSVGRGLTTTVKICDEEGNELPTRTEGHVYFAGGPSFEYHNDPAKTAAARNRHGWATLGDIGWVDEDGFLYLTDRKDFMIISGGVNIYPQEIENLLITHPKVADAAVFGAPDEDMGERVIAVVQPLRWEEAGDALASELHDFVRQALSHVKTPKQIDFRPELPRHATGKLYKRLLRDEYAKPLTAA